MGGWRIGERYGGSVDGAWRTITWSHYEHQILIAGRELNYVDIGWLGPPVVLLHGHGSTWQYWLDVIALLCQRRRVIALDLPGFGASRAHPWRTVSMAGIVATIVEFLDRLDVAKCDLVGHSMGSIFALEVAVADPNRIRTLTLAGGPALSIVSMFQHPIRTAWQYPRFALTVIGDMITAGLPLPEFVLRGVSRYPWLRKIAFGAYVARPELLAPDLCTQLTKGVGAPAYFHVPVKARRYQPAPLELIRCPVMLVNGRDDNFVPPADVEAFTARLSDARRHTIDGAGHLVTVEYPVIFAELFIDFTCQSNCGPQDPAASLPPAIGD